MIAWDLPSTPAGGVPGHIHGLTQALARDGHDIVLLSTGSGRDSNESPIRLVRASIDLPWLPDDDVVARIASANNHLTSLVHEIGSWRPDVVHAHGWETSWCATTLARIYDVPLVATFHSTERSSHGGFVPPGESTSVHSVESWLASTANDVICCSRFMMREVIDAFELSPETVHLVPNGIDPSLWRLDDGDPRTNLVLAWGRVQYEKGFQVLAQAMGRVRATLPNVQCIIAGSGPYLPELQSQVDIEGVSDIVHLAGFVPDDRLRQLLHSAGCVVIPSLYEPFGIVALESLAAGAPTIVARTGGLAEIMEGTGAGLTFEPGNALQLADHIHNVLTDADVARSLSHEGHVLLEERYTWQAVARGTLDVYAQSLGT